jgi:hypothetical protein
MLPPPPQTRVCLGSGLLCDFYKKKTSHNTCNNIHQFTCFSNTDGTSELPTMPAIIHTAAVWFDTVYSIYTYIHTYAWPVHIYTYMRGSSWYDLYTARKHTHTYNQHVSLHINGYIYLCIYVCTYICCKCVCACARWTRVASAHTVA